MSEARYFECQNCGAVVQGWHAAHWYARWHKSECKVLGPIIEIEREERGANVEHLEGYNH